MGTSKVGSKYVAVIIAEIRGPVLGFAGRAINARRDILYRIGGAGVGTF